MKKTGLKIQLSNWNKEKAETPTEGRKRETEGGRPGGAQNRLRPKTNSKDPPKRGGNVKGGMKEQEKSKKGQKIEKGRWRARRMEDLVKKGKNERNLRMVWEKKEKIYKSGEDGFLSENGCRHRFDRTQKMHYRDQS